MRGLARIGTGRRSTWTLHVVEINRTRATEDRGENLEESPIGKGWMVTATETMKDVVVLTKKTVAAQRRVPPFSADLAQMSQQDPS
mmetsp:Transcript_9429/g.17698  ORF Transcript_9429/g.17698 Transcript_9429/m.17698 type:complete len:86 (+) Transcript_9429:220-477(+)